MTLDPKELAALDPTGRFSDRAADYVKYRPGYPAAAIDAMLAELPETRPRRAADVGAGTGISARLLAARGLSVIAIEPNRAMREAAAPDPRIEWRDGTAEATGLAGASLDLVVCAQSFHWFHAERAIAEFARVLVPGGRLGLMWNRRDASDPFTAGYRQAILHRWRESRGAYTIPRQDLRGPRKFLNRSGRMGSGPRSRGVGAKP